MWQQFHLSMFVTNHCRYFLGFLQQTSKLNEYCMFLLLNTFSELAVSVWRMISFEVLGEYEFDMFLHLEKIRQKWKDIFRVACGHMIVLWRCWQFLAGSLPLVLPCLIASDLPLGLPCLQVQVQVLPLLRHLPCLVCPALPSWLPLLSQGPQLHLPSHLSHFQRRYSTRLVGWQQKTEKIPFEISFSTQWVEWRRVWWELVTPVVSQKSTVRWKTSQWTLETLPG